MAIKIGHASGDENRKAKGGVAGEQTREEVFTRGWYYNNWHTVLRPKRKNLAEKSAATCEAACANSKIGYDQGQRNTLHKQAKAVNFDMSKIATACECDCSSLMHVCAIAGGANLEYGSNGLHTRNMVDGFMKSGDYEKLTDSKYLTADAYLKRGDILVKEGHTVMVLENGENAEPDIEETVVVELNVLQKGDKGEEVKTVQRILHTLGYDLGSKNPFDGNFGPKTETAVKAYKKKHNLPGGPVVDLATWNKLLKG
jgi:hypothetical protein